eukprot:scaffold12244_cov216-Isochrysis_galbana.AAC.13
MASRIPAVAQLLLSASRACGCPTGGAAHRPILKASGFHHGSDSCGLAWLRARCASEAVASPRSSRPQAR